jgi:TonB family protein
MKNTFLALVCGLALVVILAMSWCGRKPGSLTGIPTPLPTPIATSSPSRAVTPSPTPSASAAPQFTPSPTPTPGPSQTPSVELRKAAGKVGAAVISISVFDAPGRLLHTGTGFYVANDGRFITNWHLVDGAAHAVAKSADGKIRNVSGVMASSTALDLAILKAETKTGVSFLRLSKTSEPKTLVGVVGSTLTHHEQPMATGTVSARQTDSNGDLFAISTPISPETNGAPVIDEKGEVVGVVTLVTEPNKPPSVVVRPSSAIDSLLAQTRPDTEARWAANPGESPTPSPSPKPKVVHNPLPTYPPQARSANPPVTGSGRFRILFDTNGEAKDVQIVRSTGHTILDQAAVDALREWKSTPGREWSLVVPITFQPR